MEGRPRVCRWEYVHSVERRRGGIFNYGLETVLTPLVSV